MEYLKPNHEPSYHDNQLIHVVGSLYSHVVKEEINDLFLPSNLHVSVAQALCVCD